MSGLDLQTTVQVVQLSPRRTVVRVQSRGIQGPRGDVTPELLAARDAAIQAAADAGGSEDAAALSATAAGDSAVAASDSADAAAGSAQAAAGSAQAAADSASAAQDAQTAAEAVAPALNNRMDDIEAAQANLIPEAPNDGGVYVRRGGQWVQLYAPLTVSGELPVGYVDVAYSEALPIAGGLSPYSLVGFSLPDGLTATVDGATLEVTGTPTVAEPPPFPGEVTVSDSLGGQFVLPAEAGVIGGAYAIFATWDQPSSNTVYLWRSFQAAESYEMWAPSDNAGHYTCARFRAWASAPGSILTIGRLREGMIGTTIGHANGAVTKAGTWTTSANTNAFGGGSSWSSTAGDTIQCSVTGSVLGLRLFRTTNGGYATVAIDGDYTAADKLPAVTQALIDAGKFTAGQLGHRYVSMYANTASPDLSDGHVLLTESANNAAHTITVRAAGSAPSGTGNRAYVAAFVGCTGSQLPGDSGTAMFYVRDLTSAGADEVSSMTLAWSVQPTGAPSSQFIGDNHANESLTSSAWKVDGVTVTPTANQIISGTEVKLERVVDMTHPGVVGSVATKTDTFSCRADRRYQIQYDWQVVWAQGGQMGPAYCGMLNHFVGTANGAVIGADVFNAGVVGDAAYEDLVDGTNTFGNSEETVIAFFDPAHDTVAAITCPNPTQSLNGWTYSGTGKAQIIETALNAKGYFTRAQGSGTFEPITVGQTMSGSCAWRVFRAADAYARLVAAIP